MSAPPGFGRRGLNFGPAPAPPPPGPPRRFRSEYVLVTAIGLMVIGGIADARRHAYQCRDRGPGDPDRRPDWCDSAGYGHSGGGHGSYGGGGGGYGIGHAAFGGFGHAGAGHGGGE